MSAAVHTCEDWMLELGPAGEAYCQACGKDQAPAEPAEPGVFHLGQRVRFSTHLRRRSAQSGEFRGPDKIWSNNLGPSYRGDTRWPGGEGVIVGKRTLSNGNTIWLGEDEGTGYAPSEHFTAYLIAYDLHRKPVHVLPEHITPELVEALTEEDKHFRDTGCDSSLHPEDCLSAVQGVLA